MSALLIRLTPPGILVILYSLAWAAHHYGWLPDIGLRLPRAGAVLIVAGASFLIWAAVQFHRFRTTIIPAGKPTTLLDKGPYAISRNPIYVADLAITTGIALLVGHIACYAVPLLLFLILRYVYIPAEETKMRTLFGDRFGAYCRRVRRWL